MAERKEGYFLYHSIGQYPDKESDLASAIVRGSTLRLSPGIQTTQNATRELVDIPGISLRAAETEGAGGMATPDNCSGCRRAIPRGRARETGRTAAC